MVAPGGWPGWRQADNKFLVEAEVCLGQELVRVKSFGGEANSLTGNGSKTIKSLSRASFR